MNWIFWKSRIRNWNKKWKTNLWEQVILWVHLVRYYQVMRKNYMN